MLILVVLLKILSKRFVKSRNICKKKLFLQVEINSCVCLAISVLY